MENQNEEEGEDINENYDNQFKEDNQKFLSSESCRKSDKNIDLFSYFTKRSYMEMITLGWVSKVMKIMNKSKIKVNDFGKIKEDDSSKNYSNKLKRKWKDIDFKKCNYPLIKCIFSLFKWSIAFILCLEYSSTILSAINLVIMREILVFIEGESSNRDRAVIFVLIMVIFEFISRAFLSNSSVLRNKLSRGINMSVMGLVYSKIYKISGSNQKYNKGTINNIIHTDIAEFQSIVWMIPYATSTILSIILSCFTLYTMVGLAFMVAIIITISLTVLTYLVSKYVKEWHQSNKRQMDESANYLNEMIESIKVKQKYLKDDLNYQ